MQPKEDIMDLTLYQGQSPTVRELFNIAAENLRAPKLNIYVRTCKGCGKTNLMISFPKHSHYCNVCKKEKDQLASKKSKANARQARLLKKALAEQERNGK